MAKSRKPVSRGSDKRLVQNGAIKKTQKSRGNKINKITSYLGRSQDSSEEVPNIPPNEARPEPVGTPPAWAVDRPELCDALPWFRSTQGGCYFKDGIAFGVLIDGDAGDRAHLDHEVVITRVGGGCIKVGGKLQLTEDIDIKNPAFRALIFNLEHDIPVGLVVGDRNVICTTRVPHRYNVMSFFRVTDIWYEKSGPFTGAKVRFEKLDLESQSWWAAKNVDVPIPVSERSDAKAPVLPTCPECLQLSHQVYAQGWMCLKRECKKFWTMNNRSPPTELTFAPHFLKMRRQAPCPMRPQHSLVPDLLATLPQDSRISITARVMWKGIVCPRCNRCVARTLWNGWSCAKEDGGCGFKHINLPVSVDLRSIISDFEMGATGHRYLVGNELVCRSRVQYLKNYRLDMFDLGMGNIMTHFAANTTINKREGGPNDLFRKLCTEDIGLKRHKLQASVVQGTLTSHFAVNFGMPYKYIVAVDSRPFSETPSFLLRALGRLSWAVMKTVPPTEFQQPNELLTLGYFEKMAINYHDDGEDTLGPTVATLSIGAPATMLIRMKGKYFRVPEPKKKNIAPNDLVLPGCAMEKERRELKMLYENEGITCAEYWDALARLKSSRKEAKPMCSLDLHHGDMVVMHGANLQKYFEHSVTPNGDLRFALTARYVMPELVEPEHHWKGNLEPGLDYKYDGDE
ncbi:uncharacterized protein CIMG_11674 [Coccidioides immitis RS]|uniref:Alpha-ketoglutarate-dependent dioxygenase AlkB-like domain-containing protein n=4 Tax=Coccidioides immitis TaxID=5501 RepID=A0A0E1RWJ7_COCIM|nr:uncharacterized protein CIMG_11674 [Coccidioides immitis RS]EAS30635.2 hypothetical protein CIMG_11674 [Coccidioides immitis RS]KMP03192.1 hypothetical protein CIRG_02884 [Coccidioides immitis RMSCC 2394]KMU79264.1 hypothetical protein CISG_07695 [Coccidioides immitis RMSCC 3703]KMU84768.1 hypothetical protein CIHG_02551 [Coccidioides immitis H538.4]